MHAFLETGWEQMILTVEKPKVATEPVQKSMWSFKIFYAICFPASVFVAPGVDQMIWLFSLCRSIRCGKIFCDGGNEYPVTGQKAVIVTFGGMCNIAGDQSEEDALSMVPTGTKCEHNKVSL